ncbi:DUF3558 domain-containing protein [Nocardia violaceofusca]|uniref:DUF3558 domain-containing protein n=1 Tax=Nocardia violaceofusca TaxID=941182 RepID=UPI000A07073F|nr:DUF3558 domain-containing protein [Nocardia violaceofusca]
MASWGKARRGVIVGVGLLALVSACRSGDDPHSASTNVSQTSTIAPGVPAGFDACKLPPSLVQSEELVKPEPDIKDGDGGVKWRGCGWIQSDGYSVTIDSTNISLAMVRANRDFAVADELTIAGRPALTYAQTGQDLKTHCILSTEIKGGSLEVSVNNPANRRKSAGQDSCEIAKRLTEGIAPIIPSNL